MKEVFRLTCIKDVRNLYSSILNLIVVGTKIEVSVSEIKTKRSSAQNNFYHLVCEDISKFLNEHDCHWNERFAYTKEIIHEMNKQTFSVNTTTTMSVKEFCEYMEKVFVFWQEETNNFWKPLETPYNYLERTGFLNEIQNNRCRV